MRYPGAFFIVPAFLLSFALPARSDDRRGAAPPRLPLMPASVVVEGPPLTNRVVFMLDVSSSMRLPKLDSARSALITTLREFTDDGYARIYAFNNDVYAYSTGWLRMPDALVVILVEEWLARFTPRGGTALDSALATALAHPEPDLSVVLFTDGCAAFDAPVYDAVATAGQRYGLRPIHAYCVGDIIRGRDLLRNIVVLTGGRFVEDLAPSGR